MTLLPGAAASAVTITAAVVPAPGKPLDLLPSRTRTFQSGQVVSIPVTFSQLFARVVAHLPGRNPAVTDSRSTFAPTQSVVAAMDESATSGSTTFRATSQSSSTRTVGAVNGALTIAGSGTESPQLQVTNPGANVGASTASQANGFQHTTCVSLPTPHMATCSVGTYAPGAKRPNSNSFIATLEIDSTIVNAPDGGSVLVPAGERCIKFFAEAWSCSASNVGVVTCFTPAALAWHYTVTLRPAP